MKNQIIKRALVCGAGGFIGGAKTKEGAWGMAKAAIEEQL